MKKLSKLFFIFSLVILGSFSEVSASNAEKEATKETRTLSNAEIKQLKNRVEEIQNLDKSELSWKERREIKKELKEIKKTLDLDSRISISVGALIIIVLLLIIIL
ncbi:hypothetical protein [Marivirga sp.]|uniref:hypothetical protein n=1 Tax=Marivirga sp. TaxID=2018662 RepID=UPI002D80C594|nr:hypothetical protein [Marivirga sp.]HET8860827.1 hypothetical protein [Marivirga sp.]